jgi:lysophospholipase L1-like esterase
MMPPIQIVFVGSSIMEGWFNLGEYFPATPFLNTAIGGTQTHEIYARLDELVIRHAPGLVCYYCGSNDINHGATAECIVTNVRQTFETLRCRLPAVQFLYLAIIKAPQKIDRWDVVDQVNCQLAALAAGLEGFHFLDVNPLFFDTNGQPLLDFYVADLLHLTPQAYQAMGEFVGPKIMRIL